MIFALLLIGFSSVFLIAKPTLFFSVVIIFSLLGVGLFESFFNLSQANWIGFSLAAILFPSLFFYTWNVKDAGKVRLRRFDLYVISYLLAIVMSGLVNMTPPLQFIVGLKAYLPFLAVYFVLSPIIFSFDDFRRFLQDLLTSYLGSRDVDNQRASLINNFNKFVSYVTDINLKKIMSVVIFFLVSVLCGVSLS